MGNLNNTPVGGKKRAKSHDVLWNIKYLPKFKWTHLSERLAYEKAVHQQRLRTEISQAKREADFFKANVEKSKRLARKRKSEIETMDEAMVASNWPPQNIPLAVPGDKNKKKPGIIYLSSIPPGFNVSCTIAFFSQFGKVGRVFLQPDLKEKNKRKDKIARHFTEGWIEFLSKRVAKEVATNLNNTPVGGKKRSKAHDVLWNIKYLPKFKWTNLSERLAYEKAVHHQRLRTE